MTDKELSKLRRTELLELLIAQGKEYTKLQEELHVTQKALHKREIAIEKAGTIAEASYKLNDVVGSTQRAVDQYVQNVTRMITQQQEESSDAVSKARNYATETVAIAEKRARSLLNAASEQAAQIVSEARVEADRILAQAKVSAEQIEADAQIKKMELLAQARREMVSAQESIAPAPEKKPRGFFRSRS